MMTPILIGIDKRIPNILPEPFPETNIKTESTNGAIPTNIKA
jgi:hypothetical protein